MRLSPWRPTSEPAEAPGLFKVWWQNRRLNVQDRETVVEAFVFGKNACVFQLVVYKRDLC